MKRKSLLPSFFLFAFLIGCTTEAPKNRIRAIFDTKSEAEKAAEKFNCVGAHKMGDKWMPCDSHQAHENHTKNSGNGHHQNH